jgi:hypothetical protein
MRHHLRLGLCPRGASRARRVSVVINVASYIIFLAGNVPLGALLKMVAEFLRLPYFYYTQAWDMVWLAFFFIIASLALLIPVLL